MRRARPGWRQGVRSTLGGEDEAALGVKATASAIEKMLGVTGREARRLARACESGRAELQKLTARADASRALAALRRTPLPAGVADIAGDLAARRATYLLALPFTASSVRLLAHLLADAARQFYVIDTPLGRTYLGPLADAAGNARLVSAAELIRHNRAREGAGAVTYVTFPDHQFTGQDTAWPVPFCGENHLMPLVEPVLFFRGVGPLLTLDSGSHEQTGGFGLCAYTADAPGRPAGEADARALLGWLATRMERVFRAAPAEVLSWQQSYARSAGRRALNELVRLNAVEGFLRVWRADGESLDAEVADWALAELGRVRARLTQSPAPPRAPDTSAQKTPEVDAAADLEEGVLHTPRLMRRLILRAPAACARAFALLADLDYYRQPKANRRLRQNLALAFPESGDAHLGRVVRRQYRSSYQRVVSTIHISSMSPEQRVRYLETHVELRGAGRLRAACESPKPLVFFTPHYGDYVIGCLRGILEVTRFKKLSVFYDPPEKNPATLMYKRLIDSLGCGVNVLYNDQTAVLKGLRALRGGGALAIMPDVYELNSHALCVPFFGRLMVAMGGTAFFAVKSGAELMPAYCYRQGPSRYVLQLDDPVEVSRTGDFQEDLYRTTANIFRSIERQLNALPEHWAYWNSLQERFRLASNVELPRGPVSWPSQFAALRERFADGQPELKNFLASLADRLEPSPFLHGPPAEVAPAAGVPRPSPIRMLL